VTQVQLIRDLGEYAIWFSFLAAVAFPLVTSLFWPWWQHSWGWNIVTLEMAIAVALLPAWLHYAFGFTIAASTGFAWLQVGAVMLVGVIIVWRTVLIFLTQRHGLGPQT
jgi:hypothetical protein